MSKPKANGHDAFSTPIGVVDIGSNSVRLLIFDAVVRSPTPLFNEKVLCGLGREIASTGMLSNKSMDQALQAMRRFRAIAAQLGTGPLHVIATAAVREANNADEFVANAESICGNKISILSGKEEAKMAAYGLVAGVANADGMAGDMGGGSLELIDIKKNKLFKFTSLPLGGLHLIDVSNNDLKKAVDFIDTELAKVPWLKNGRGRPFYAIGGAWRAFAKLHMAHTKYPLRVMHAYKISYSEAVAFAQLINHLSPTSLKGIKTISRARRETVPFGALVLERAFTIMRPSEFIVSAYGIREGLVYSLLSKEEQLSDPLLSACADFARSRAKSADYCHELCQWTDTFFETSGLKETPEDRRLRHAACLLSDIGWRINPEYRGEQSLSMIAHATFAGVDHPGRVFMALAVYYRYSGPKKLGLCSELSKITDKKTIERAKILGAAIRIANDVSAGTPGIISNTPLLYRDKKLILDLAPPHHTLEGERLTRRVEYLAKLLNRNLQIETDDKVFVQESARV